MKNETYQQELDGVTACNCEAIKRKQAGELTLFDIAPSGLITWGYGQIDERGMFEFPLPYEYLTNGEQAFVKQLSEAIIDGGSDET